MGISFFPSLSLNCFLILDGPKDGCVRVTGSGIKQSFGCKFCFAFHGEIKGHNKSRVVHGSHIHTIDAKLIKGQEIKRKVILIYQC